MSELASGNIDFGRSGMVVSQVEKPAIRYGLFSVVVLGLAFAAGLSNPAFAQSSACLQLVNELAALDSGGGFRTDSAKYRQYDKAAKDQRAQIAKTQRAARQNGCTAGIFSSNSPVCQRIRNSLEQMTANLASLENTRDRLGGGGNDSRRRRSIINEMARLGCQNRTASQSGVVDARSAEPRRRTLLEQIFGVRTYREDGNRGSNGIDPDTGLASRYGTFRTLCVRKCDGYYFPVSFSTTRERFEQDAQSCQAMCPGAEVELYYHGMPSQDSEDMISYRTDEPYTSLATAFSYRKKISEGCECKFSRGGLFEVAGSGSVSEVTGEQPREERIGIPVFKTDPALDPETAANGAAGLTPQYLASLGKSEESEAKPVANLDERRIRVVGPEFFPVQ
ncbi:MAG: DUF2865 domain-containing protein [Nitratireductor sp.]